MAHFTAGYTTPAEVSRQRVADADVLVVIAGFRYGSPVVDQPDRSYVELEFAVAAEAGLPRLVFLLDEQAEGPVELFRDVEFGARQEAFRARLLDGELTVRTIRTANELEIGLLQSLTQLRHDRSAQQVTESTVGSASAEPSAEPEPDPAPGPDPALDLRFAADPAAQDTLDVPWWFAPLAPSPDRGPGDVSTLAALLSPASRVEPELLRAIRLACLPELPVEAEHELWFDHIVDARSDAAITFAPEAVRELRQRLRAMHGGVWRPVVERARTVMAELHAPISPLLGLEEEMAWTEVTGDAARAADLARNVVQAMAAGRDGVQHWVRRVWPTLPAGVRESPSGWVLAQVAAERDDLPAPPAELDGDQVNALAAVLPRTQLNLALADGVLRLGVDVDEADASIELPRTEPAVVEVDGIGRLLIDSGQPVRVEVGTGPVRLRTIAGDVYEVGDARWDLLDTVRTGPGGHWCLSRIRTDAFVLGCSRGIVEALGALPTDSGTPVDLAPMLGATQSSGSLFGIRRRRDTAASSAVDPSSELAVRDFGEFRPGMVVRSIAGVDGGPPAAVALRTGTVGADGLGELDTAGRALVAGAPLVDDADRLVGVVAPPNWGRGPVAVPSDLLGTAADLLVGRVDDEWSDDALLVVTRTSALPSDGYRLSRDERELAAASSRIWVVTVGPGDETAELAYLISTPQVVRRTARWYLVDSPPASTEVVAPNDARGLVAVLVGPDNRAGLHRLDVAGVGLLESFVAAVRPRPQGPVLGRAAARVGDPTSHPGVLAPPGVPTVLIGGAPAAVVGTVHVCSMPPPNIHSPSPVVPPGSATVLIGGRPAARMGDLTGCGAVIVAGSPTVLIG
jgi:uncharacterized Zn-binding protein involved in type VI secretion